MITLAMALTWLPAAQAGDDDAHPLASAWDSFLKAEEHAQLEVVEEIARRVDAIEDVEVRRLIALRDRARRELKIMARPEDTLFEAEEYAPGQVKRRFVEDDSAYARRQRDVFFRYGADPQYIGRVRYDFGDNVAYDLGVELLPEDNLWNALYGYPEGADVLVAWLQLKLDHRDELDHIARHFSRCYANLNGQCVRGVTLYDAFSSMQGVDMPDADVIAFARRLMDDHSWVSPIPQGGAVNKLYDAVNAGFLRYFRHRTLVEYVSNLMVNPESPIDYSHEALRERILYALHLDEVEPMRVRNRLIDVGNRSGFIRKMDALAEEDDSWRWYGRAVAGRINQPRWIIAGIAQDVLKERGFLTE